MNSDSDVTPEHEHEHEHEHFSLRLFILTVVLTVAGFCAILRFAAPELWTSQWQSSLWSFAGAFAAISLLNCFVEFFFHRYVLHRPAVPGLRRMYRQHTLHHALTRIGRKPARDGRTVLCVENKFPITEPEQGEGSFFPWYSLAVFTTILLPVFALLQWLVPSFPWFVGGLAALTSSLILYELLHAINHWPLEIWLPLIEHRTWGWFWRPVYSFHLRHHAVIDCNESVSGFFGLPIADWMFGTCVIPPTIYADGEAWKPENFVAPRPRRLISWLDGVADRAIAARRQAESQTLPETPARRPYSRGEELANWLTHGVGAAVSVVGLTLLIVFAGTRGDVWHVVGFTLFGLSLVALYLFSTLYHFTRSERRKQFFRRLDQAAIFLLVGGTYTPFLLAYERGPWSWTLLGITWALCLAGALSKVLGGERSRIALALTYASAIWLIIVAAQPMLAFIPDSALWFLAAGIACYAAGLPFCLWQRLRYHHAYWHSFVLAGSACHFLAVVFLLQPAST
jgi:hemolysin III